MEIPALSVCCSLAGGQGVEWPEEANEDWERLVRGKQFTMRPLMQIVPIFVKEE